MSEYTKDERAKINAAWNALVDLCSCTNWSDGPALSGALKLERSQMGNVTVARAMVCKAWAEGLANPDRPARRFYWVRPGYLTAYMLGVRHAVERASDDYTGPKVESARALCGEAIAANDAQTARIVEG